MEITFGILVALWLATMIAVSMWLSFMPQTVDWFRRYDPSDLHQIPSYGRITFGFLARTLIVWFFIVVSLPQSMHYEVLLLQCFAAFLTGIDAGSLATRLSNSDINRQRAREDQHRERFNPLADVHSRLLWNPASEQGHTYTSAVERLQTKD